MATAAALLIVYVFYLEYHRAHMVKSVKYNRYKDSEITLVSHSGRECIMYGDCTVWHYECGARAHTMLEVKLSNAWHRAKRLSEKD